VSSILEQPNPPAPPVAARTVQPMGEDEMPVPKKRLGRPPKNADGSTPKKRGPKPGFKRRKRRRSAFGKIADKVAKAKAPARSAAVDLATSTFAVLGEVLDLKGCAPVVHSAWKAHKAALALLAG